MTTQQITRPAQTDFVRYFNLNNREVTRPATRAQYAGMHAAAWQREADLDGVVSTFACDVCKTVLPTGHAHVEGCEELLALWP